MKTYESFLDEVMPHVPGCQVNIAVNAIRNTVVEFCEKSLILQRDHDPVTVIAGIADYDLDPPNGYLVTKIMKAWHENVPLVAAAPDEIGTVAVYNQQAPGADGPGLPRWILQKDERSFSLLPVPADTSVNGVFMRVALKPTRSSTSVEDVIFEDYLEVIGYGAKARLMFMPNKPWTDLNNAGTNKILFEQGVNTARQRANRGHTRSNLSVRLRKV